MKLSIFFILLLIFTFSLNINQGFRYVDYCTENYCYVIDNGIIKDLQNIAKCIGIQKCENVAKSIMNLDPDKVYFPFTNLKIYIIEVNKNAREGNGI